MAKYCCEPLDQVMEKYGFPFYEPVTWDMETGELEAPGLCLKLWKATKAGRPSTVGHSAVPVYFCPFCGTKLQDKG